MEKKYYIGEFGIKYYINTEFPLKISYIFDEETWELYSIRKTKPLSITEIIYYKLMELTIKPDYTNKVANFLDLTRENCGIYVYRHDFNFYLVEVFM